MIDNETPADKIVCILYKYNTMRTRIDRITNEILKSLADQDPDELIDYIRMFKGEENGTRAIKE